MKTIGLVTLALVMAAFTATADSTINSHTSSNSAWGANIGWVNWRGDTTNGAVIGDFVCSGYIYSANVGWISLGSGNPANSIRYANSSGSDFGVNHDGVGNLRGYAYGANIGWINFENTGSPRVNLQTGVLSGYAWGANVGWISLSNAVAVVKTDSLFAGNDSDSDRLPDAWELTYVGNLTALTAAADPDGDGVNNTEEYRADTNPIDPNSKLRITSNSVSFFGDDDVNTLTWSSRPTRNYRVEHRLDLTTASWFDVGVLFSPDPGTTTTRGIAFSNTPSTQRFFHVKAVRPLSP